MSASPITLPVGPNFLAGVVSVKHGIRCSIPGCLDVRCAPQC